MHLLKKIILIILVLIVLILGVLFGSRNNTIVSVDLFFTTLPPMSITLLMLLSLSVGALISAGIFGIVAKTYKVRYQKLLRKVTSDLSSDTTNRTP